MYLREFFCLFEKGFKRCLIKEKEESLARWGERGPAAPSKNLGEDLEIRECRGEAEDTGRFLSKIYMFHILTSPKLRFILMKSRCYLTNKIGNIFIFSVS